MITTPADFMAWSRRSRWRWARTYAKTAPHWYTVKKWCVAFEFEAAADFIKAQRRREFRYGAWYNYYFDVGLKFWVSDYPVRCPEDLSQEICIINREPINGYDKDGL